MSELLSSMGLLEAEIEAFGDLHLISQRLGLESPPPHLEPGSHRAVGRAVWGLGMPSKSIPRGRLKFLGMLATAAHHPSLTFHA